MTHIAIQANVDGAPVNWLEHVTDVDYLGCACKPNDAQPKGACQRPAQCSNGAPAPDAATRSTARRDGVGPRRAPNYTFSLEINFGGVRRPVLARNLSRDAHAGYPLEHIRTLATGRCVTAV